MNATDLDPVRRWQAISAWYAGFARMEGWEFLDPMAGLTAWVARQPFAAPLFPFTSHEWLCVGLHTGYEPGRPFFSCGVQAGGRFRCSLWAAVGESRGERVAGFEQAREVLAAFASRLVGGATDAEPGGAADGGGMTALPDG